MQLQSFSSILLLYLSSLGSAVNFDCHPSIATNMAGRDCPINVVPNNVYRASCGTAGALDWSPGSGSKNGRIKIQNLGNRNADYYYLYAKGGERTHFKKVLNGGQSCDWELPPGASIGQVSFVLH